MINRLVALFVCLAIGVSAFPYNKEKSNPVGCSVKVSASNVLDQPIVVANDHFEQFLDETKTKYTRAKVTVITQSMSNGDLLVRYRQDSGSERSYIDLDFAVSKTVGTINVWRHQPYTDRSEYAADPIKSFYQREVTSESSVQLSEGPSLIEMGQDMPSVFICRPGKFSPQGIGLIRYVGSTQLTKVIIGTNLIKLRLYLEPTTDGFEDGFVIVSNSRLLDLENKRNQMFLIAHDFWRVKPLLSDGWWYSSQQGVYEGAIQDCYYPNPGFYPSRSMLMWYCQLDNRLFYDIVLTTMKMACDSVMPEGFARMPIKPVHFSSVYGFFKDYVDTRFSTDGERFLIKCAKLLDCKKARETAGKLAQFYLDNLDQASSKTGEGLLISDYIFYSPPSQPVHVSLNHSLCIVNYLLEYEELFGQSEYSALADKILTAIDETSSRWIRVNGDLWYAYYPATDTFDTDDYELLTYNDLQETQWLLEKVRGKSAIAIQTLFQSKQAYLEEKSIIKRRQNANMPAVPIISTDGHGISSISE